MDQLVLTPSPAPDFNFDGTGTSSSPKMSIFPSFFYSAPTSPTRSSSSSHQHSQINPDDGEDLPSTVPFVSQEQKLMDYDEDVDFAFEFSGQLERSSISDADELFHGGKIKPLEPPPPRLNISNDQPITLSQRSYTNKYTKRFVEEFHQTPGDQQIPSPRGREKTTAATTTTSHKTSLSLSPMRVSDILSDDQKVTTSQSSSPFGFTWYNKWNLKNLLLFRSTSDGSATTINDSLKNYGAITKGDQDVKNSSFRSSDGDGSVSRRRKMKRKMSAHEIHYTANRAVAEEMKRKTFLPYKSGLLDCLGFSQKLNEISRGR